MSLGVRPIRPPDVPAAVRAILDGAAVPDAEDPEDVASYWAAVESTRERGGEVLVAEDDGVVVGVCQLVVFRHFMHQGGWCAEIESVFVRADHRGRGAGAALIAAAESRARAAGCYRIQLTSRNERLDAHRFYVAHGYGATHQGFKKSLA